MTTDQVLRKILDQTYIMLSALESNDLDVMFNALEKRAKWIAVYDHLLESNEEHKVMLAKFEKLNSQCMVLLEKQMKNLNAELNRVKIDKNRMVQMQRVHQRYQTASVELSGSVMDLKK